MTDEQSADDPTPGDDPTARRAEQAFRDALSEHADDVDADDLRIPIGSRPRLRWLAVAAALIVVALIGSLAIRQFTFKDVADDPAPNLGALPAPERGFQWVSSRDVAVQVPREWGHAVAPAFTNLCGVTRKPQERPYYSTFTGAVATLAIACPGTLTRDLDVMHLRLVHGEPSEQFPDWYRVRQKNGLQVAVAVPSGTAEDEALARKILASATTFTTDQAGCTPRSPIDRLPWVRPTPAFDITSVTDVQSVSLCQYERPSTEQEDNLQVPRLVASAVIPPDGIAGLLQALRSAPAVEPAKVARCSSTQARGDGVVLRIRTTSGEHEMYAYFEGCGGIDDGTTVRKPVAGWCGPVFSNNAVKVMQMSSEVGEACNPAPAVTPSTSSSGLPTPEDGFQWVSSRDVAVQVPTSWAYGVAPGSDWCAGDQGRFPTAPYYDSFTGDRIRLAIGCPGPLPRSSDVMHLELGRPVEGSTPTPVAWHRTRRLGEVVVTVSVPSGSTQDEALATKILASVRPFTLDQFGCAPYSPISKWPWSRPGAPFDVTTVGAVDSISLCQYQKSATSPDDAKGPAARLLASQRLTGEAAQNLLAAIRKAPAGGGPDAPETCLADQHDTNAILVRLWTSDGPRDMYANVGNCRNNGIDDGTTMRAVTRDWCPAVFAQPLQWDSMSGNVAPLCRPS